MTAPENGWDIDHSGGNGGFKMPRMPSGTVIRCNYCTRLSTILHGNCAGCGAPLSIPAETSGDRLRCEVDLDDLPHVPQPKPTMK